MRVLVLGAGFGGLELSTRLSAALGADADVVARASATSSSATTASAGWR
ncbi:hypothetical protein [Frankia sp. AgB32]|nr:hypothetical protein [Frankia sp. AgB32]MCK9895471.1 hypothetical protein [Frankia sp. AgB32]